MTHASKPGELRPRPGRSARAPPARSRALSTSPSAPTTLTPELVAVRIGQGEAQRDAHGRQLGRPGGHAVARARRAVRLRPGAGCRRAWRRAAGRPDRRSRDGRGSRRTLRARSRAGARPPDRNTVAEERHRRVEHEAAVRRRRTRHRATRAGRRTRSPGRGASSSAWSPGSSENDVSEPNAAPMAAPSDRRPRAPGGCRMAGEAGPAAPHAMHRPSGRDPPRCGCDSRRPRSHAPHPRTDGREQSRPSVPVPAGRRRGGATRARSSGDRTATAATPLTGQRAPGAAAYGRYRAASGHPEGGRRRAFASPTRRSSTRPTRPSPGQPRSVRSAARGSRSARAAEPATDAVRITESARRADEVVDEVVDVLQPDRDAHRPRGQARRGELGRRRAAGATSWPDG